jgi:hypothetical protein
MGSLRKRLDWWWELAITLRANAIGLVATAGVSGALALGGRVSARWATIEALVFGFLTGGPVGAAQGCTAAAGGSALTGGVMDTVHETAESIGRLARIDCRITRSKDLAPPDELDLGGMDATWRSCIGQVSALGSGIPRNSGRRLAEPPHPGIAGYNESRAVCPGTAATRMRRGRPS